MYMYNNQHSKGTQELSASRHRDVGITITFFLHLVHVLHNFNLENEHSRCQNGHITRILTKSLTCFQPNTKSTSHY